jgi:hypothetical protein
VWALWRSVRRGRSRAAAAPFASGWALGVLALASGWAREGWAQMPRPPAPSPPYGAPSPWRPSPPPPVRAPSAPQPWPDELPRPPRSHASTQPAGQGEMRSALPPVAGPSDRPAELGGETAGLFGLGAVRAVLGSTPDTTVEAGAGLVVAAGGVRTASPSALAWGARAGLGRRAGAWEAEAEGSATFGFVAPLAPGGGPFARLGAGGGALQGAAGRVAYLTFPSAELGYQTIRNGIFLLDAGLRAGSILAGGVDPPGAPATTLPLAAAAGAFVTLLAPASGLALEGRLLHWGARAPVTRARGSACWFRDPWGLCLNIDYDRISPGPRAPGAEALVGGVSFGLGTLRGGEAPRP